MTTLSKEKNVSKSAFNGDRLQKKVERAILLIDFWCSFRSVLLVCVLYIYRQLFFLETHPYFAHKFRWLEIEAFYQKIFFNGRSEGLVWRLIVNPFVTYVSFSLKNRYIFFGSQSRWQQQRILMGINTQ